MNGEAYVARDYGVVNNLNAGAPKANNPQRSKWG